MRSSLRFAVVVALLLGLLVPTAAVLLFDLQKTRLVALEDVRRDLSRSVEVMALSLAEPVWQVSPDLAEPMIKAQFDDPRFVSVVVLEPANSNPFQEHRRAQASGEQDLTLSATRPVVRDGRQIASVTVEMSAAPLLAEKRADMVRSLWRSAATLTFSLVLILFVMQRRVLRPMTRLTQAAEALAAGALDKPLELSGSDEIARVGQAMEHMRKELQQAFESLQGHANTLEAQVVQRTQEVTRKNEDLEQALGHLRTAQHDLVESEKLASLGRLVAGVAHEMNTPLGNSLTVVSSLEDRFRKLEELLASNTPMRRSVLEELVRDARRGQDILQRNVQKAADLVREFKQVAIDQTSDLRRDFDLAKVVEDVLVMVEPSFKRTPFQVQVSLEPEILMNSYPGSLGQVLTNLMINALVHGFHGRSMGVVRVQTRRLSPSEVELSVSDDGAGMDESVRRRIFDPFFTTKLGTGGSGLGMHIVHNMVTNVLGGQIDVISSPGQGARMVIRMPCVAPQRSGEVAPTDE